MTASISIVTEALYEAIAAASEEKETEEDRRTRMKRVDIEDKDPCDVVGWEVVLQEVQLENAGGNEKHPSLLVDQLTLFDGPGLSLQLLCVGYVG